MQMEPYLFFDGCCEEALAFYAHSLGGEVLAMQRYAGSPLEEQLPADWHAKIMHATLEAPGGHRLMACDRMPGQAPGGHDGFALSIHCPSDAEHGERIFRSLSEGGTVTMPFTVTFWGAHFGTLVDRYGVGWMINCEGGHASPGSA